LDWRNFGGAQAGCAMAVEAANKTTLHALRMKPVMSETSSEA